MVEENQQDNRSNSDRYSEQRRAQEQAQREERRAKEQAQRDERKEKEAAARGTSSSGPSKRQEAKEAAKEYGIDTKGMSTREINSAVNDTREQIQMVAEEMSKFVNTTSQQFATNKKSEDLNATRSPAVPTSRITEDKPSKFVVSGPTSPKPATPIGGDGGGGSGGQFPPEGWTTLKVAMCKDNAEVEATFLAVDPFA
jgi:hypothetical protein